MITGFWHGRSKSQTASADPADATLRRTNEYGNFLAGCQGTKLRVGLRTVNDRRNNSSQVACTKDLNRQACGAILLTGLA
ncbi:hypothetical protein [Ciceribacter selenitireducens]|uniref:hypothetical protein n=1 Tax=Ciceribacter selenitireducens TaxID=448181 RepID=UPI00146F978A|nr:hypothetical protein [Ciceribacter selenitireducens]